MVDCDEEAGAIVCGLVVIAVEGVVEDSEDGGCGVLVPKASVVLVGEVETAGERE